MSAFLFDAYLRASCVCIAGVRGVQYGDAIIPCVDVIMKLDTQCAVDRIGWRFDNSYARLPEVFYRETFPVPVPAPQVAMLNDALAEKLGLDMQAMTRFEIAMLFSGNKVPVTAFPIAQAYAGHQFGHFTMLGDGRAILLGEHLTPTGERVDIQLKGSGQTQFSRRGDGRAALAPMLREYIVSEAMHALNIPTTRSLAVVTTGEFVKRETLLPGAILTRVAASHIRVGTFEYAAGLGSTGYVKLLADHVIERHYPELIGTENPYLMLLNRVIARQASLVAKWMSVGFIHGVMNTDNMTVSGETIDYGPCAFMDVYDPNTVFSSIDSHGRYSYRNQPHAAQWNLARFAETLLTLLDPAQDKAIALAEKTVRVFSDLFQDYWLTCMRKKLGLFTVEADDAVLVESLLTCMQKYRADYTSCFRRLMLQPLPTDTLFQGDEFSTWYTHWQARLLRQPESWEQSLQLMQANNPAIIPRNHRVEEALAAAAEGGDYTIIHRLLAALSDPYADIPEYREYTLPPEPIERVYRTFCGT